MSCSRCIDADEVRYLVKQHVKEMEWDYYYAVKCLACGSWRLVKIDEELYKRLSYGEAGIGSGGGGNAHSG